MRKQTLLIHPYLFAGLAEKPNDTKVQIDRIVAILFKHFREHLPVNIKTIEDFEKALYSPKRSRVLASSRMVLFYYLRMCRNYGLVQIGLMFNRDHSTVIHGIKEIPHLINQGFCIGLENKLKEYINFTKE